MARGWLALVLLAAACSDSSVRGGPELGDGDPPGADAPVTDAPVTDDSGDPDVDEGDGDVAPSDEGDVGPDEMPPDEDPVPVNPLDGRGAVTLVDADYQFLEGPRWVPALGALLFTDIQANTIYRLDPPSTITPYRTDSQGANGLGLDTQGRLLACEHTTRRVSRRLDNGTWETVVDTYMGARFNSPNDLIVRSDGTIYFTDPPYATPSGQGELSFAGVFRLAPGGELTYEWAGALSTRPNGVMLSPDERTLYVAENVSRDVYAFDVETSGALANERVFAQEDCAGDGMAMDEAGNLYLACAAGIGGVLVLAPDGTPWGHIPTAAGPTNVGFGDADRRTLYITTPDALYSVRLSAPGIY